MSHYRTHLCSELTDKNLNQQVTLSGWVDTIRDHGNLLFIDLRDNYGITQCVVDGKHNLFGDQPLDSFDMRRKGRHVLFPWTSFSQLRFSQKTLRPGNFIF